MENNRLKKAEWETLRELLGYPLHNQELYEQALTHDSAKQIIGYSYQRLEFLGDRVLALVITETLMERYPHEAEGSLARRVSALVKMHACAQVAEDIQLAPLIRVSNAPGQNENIKSPSVCADVVEALIGALYIDGGLEIARSFILSRWAEQIDTQIHPPHDAKSALQEWAQAKGMNIPHYNIVSKEGPDHKPWFVIEVSLNIKFSLL